MAYKKPNETTVRLAFSGGFEGRNSTTSKDKRFVNMYLEKSGTGDNITTRLVKRPGIASYDTIMTGDIRGAFGWQGDIYYVIQNKVYVGLVEVATLTTTTGNIGYTYCTSANIASLFFCDGTDGYLISNTGTITKVTDADFPSPHIPTPVYIDGYVCLPRANSADIYNCDLENPLSWTASNYITSELFPDNLMALARQNNQIVAFGSTGTEFFYDAANATGTPFAKNSGAFLQIGSCAPFAIGQNERYCFFISQSQSGGRSVWKLDGFQPTQIGTDAIDRILDAEGTDIDKAQASLIRVGGHFFYVLHLTTRTFVYDIDLDCWHEWSTNKTSIYGQGRDPINNDPINLLVINSSGTSTGQSTIVSDEPFAWRNVVDIGDGKVYVVHNTDGFVGHLDPFTYQDMGQTIKCSINTLNIDFGGYHRKFLHRMAIVGDLATNTMYVKWSDDDYQTWSKLHEVNMTIRPVLHRLGAIRRRAFNLYYTDNYPLRLEALEFVISEGTT